MKRLGISLYPEISNNLQKDKEYLDLAAKYGFTRLFVCLLSTSRRSRSEVVSMFYDLNAYAKEKGFEIIFDVSPQKFKELQINYQDLTFFKELMADGIRMDESFSGREEAEMTYNPLNLKIELNASVFDHLIDRILCFQPDREKLITCHNYYPLKYTGLGIKSFKEATQEMKTFQLSTAVFVTSQNIGCFGPCFNEGLCTLEKHRDLPLELQVRHLKAMDIVDDIIIGNAYASEDELRAMKEAADQPLTLNVESGTSTVLEEMILYDFNHTARGDISEYMIRSTMPRVIYRDVSIPPHNTKKQVYRGDIIIMNDRISRYKGEVHLVLQTMENDGRMNVVGSIPKKEWILLDEIRSWSHFMLRKEGK